jgi:uncharacterized protein (DUF2267 family)
MTQDSAAGSSACAENSRGLSVSDDALTEQVRAQLKLVSDELNLPQVHAEVVHQVATLHGSVHRDSDANSLEEAAAAVSGVDGVIFHVHELAPVTAARSDRNSAALRQLLAAAHVGGCTEPADAVAVRTVLAIFLEHLPAADRTALLAHLPADVRRLAISPRRSGIAVSLLANNLATIVEAVASVVAIPQDTAHEVVVTVLQTLHDVLPADVGDIQADLPGDLRNVWIESPHPSGRQRPAL